MTLPAYPIARDAHDALRRLRRGDPVRAGRQKAAQNMSGVRVAFVTQMLGPVYENRDDALNAYAGLVEDDRQEHMFSPLPEDRVCRLISRMPDTGARQKPVAPSFTDGRRWPESSRAPVACWQLSIAYWKIIEDEARTPGIPPREQARHLRRKPEAKDLTPEEVLAMVNNPLTAARPQKALDFGLFDFIPPDQPGIVIADE